MTPANSASYFGSTKAATITQAKNQLSALIDRVRHGETIVITDRGRPVARLVPEVARRLVRVHDLRTADALQLSAALFVTEGRPSTLDLVSLDERLLAAARREGLSTTPM